METGGCDGEVAPLKVKHRINTAEKGVCDQKFKMEEQPFNTKEKH